MLCVEAYLTFMAMFTYLGLNFPVNGLPPPLPSLDEEEAAPPVSEPLPPPSFLCLTPMSGLSLTRSKALPAFLSVLLFFSWIDFVLFSRENQRWQKREKRRRRKRKQKRYTGKRLFLSLCGEGRTPDAFSTHRRCSSKCCRFPFFSSPEPEKKAEVVVVGYAYNLSFSSLCPPPSLSLHLFLQFLFLSPFSRALPPRSAIFQRRRLAEAEADPPFSSL